MPLAVSAAGSRRCRDTSKHGVDVISHDEEITPHVLRVGSGQKGEVNIVIGIWQTKVNQQALGVRVCAVESVLI